MAPAFLRLGRQLSNSFARGSSCKWRHVFGRAMATDVSDNEEIAAPSNGGNEEKPKWIPTFQGVYKAVLLGEVTQPPNETVLRSGKSIINIYVATGGMRIPKNNNDDPSAARQIHKVVVYQDRLKEIGLKVKKGSQVYLEGNIESRVFNDPTTKIVKVVREIALRQNGSLSLVEDLELKGFNSKSNPNEAVINS